jgi:hypothetical protein
MDNRDDVEYDADGNIVYMPFYNMAEAIYRFISKYFLSKVKSFDSYNLGLYRICVFQFWYGAPTAGKMDLKGIGMASGHLYRRGGNNA